MSTFQSNIVKLSLAAAATWLLAGCVVVPHPAQGYGTVYPSPSSTYYPPVYQPYYSQPLTSPYYSPWYEPSFQTYPNYPYPSNNLPAAQVRPVDNGQVPLNREGPERSGPDRSNLPAAQVRPVN